MVTAVRSRGCDRQGETVVGVVLPGVGREAVSLAICGGRFRAGGAGRCGEIGADVLAAVAMRAQQSAGIVAESFERGGERLDQGQSRSSLSWVRRPWRHELGGDVQQPLAKSFRFGGRRARRSGRSAWSSRVGLGRSARARAMSGCARRRGGGGCACRCPCRRGCCPRRGRGRGDAAPAAAMSLPSWSVRKHVYR